MPEPTAIPARDGSLAQRPAPAPPVVVGAGRQLPLLAFVTTRTALTGQLGLTPAALQQALPNHRLVVLPSPVTSPAALDTVMLAVRAELQRPPQPQGVVLIGGYDTLLAQRVL